MKRPVLLALATAGLVVASHALASIAPQRVPVYAYREMVPPDEYVASAAGGPGVVLAENIRERVTTYRVEGGGPCGKSDPYLDSGSPRRSDPADPDDEARGAWVTIGAVGAVFGVLAVTGLVLLRRTRV